MICLAAQGSWSPKPSECIDYKHSIGHTDIHFVVYPSAHACLVTGCGPSSGTACDIVYHDDSYNVVHICRTNRNSSDW